MKMNCLRILRSQQRVLLNFSQVTVLPTSGNCRAMASDRKVVHSSEGKEFYIELDPPDRAVLEYEVMPNGLVDMHHTGVPTAYRGQGIAGLLAKAAFERFTSENTKMLLTCTYLQKYYRDHPDATTPDLVSLPS